MKRIILCADDYGQNTAISQAIIDLIKKNRLSATSCMTTSTFWPSQAKWLAAVAGQAEMGLHFNLTQGRLLTPLFDGKAISLGKLILLAQLRQLNQTAIEAELIAQIDQFHAALGKDPDFIDGHQHIHQLPVIRDALLNVYAKRFAHTRCYIRSVRDLDVFGRMSQSGFIKNLIIQLCGAFALEKELVKRKIPHNTSFAGIYNFKNAKEYAKYFKHFLATSQDGGMIMCHPGLSAPFDEADTIAAARTQEYEYFQSDLFIKECAVNQVNLR